MAALGAWAAPARADLQLCNRMSYVVEAAIGIDDKGAMTTRGWFRVDPGTCRSVIQGEVQADALYLHARALAVYGASPLPQGGHADLCVQQDTFVLTSARACARAPEIAGRRMPSRSAMSPITTSSSTSVKAE